jgi:hypothetical protein
MMAEIKEEMKEEDEAEKLKLFERLIGKIEKHKNEIKDFLDN